MKEFKKQNTDTQKGAVRVPRLAMINDIAGFGRCSTAVSLPIISVLGVQVCPVPTSVLSNHFGFPVWHFDDYTPHMTDYLNAWKTLQLSFDGLYCGFLGSLEQFGIVENFLQDFQPSLFLLDPVMGDHGRAYRTITGEHCLRMKSLMRHAHILTPNITEACLLTDTPYKDEPWQEEELVLLCRRLSEQCSGKIVITGLKADGYFQNFIWEKGVSSIYSTKAAGSSRPGTGDIFASILAACALQSIDFAASVQKAADFVALCIRGSEEAGTPVQEGVLFEKYLRCLL